MNEKAIKRARPGNGELQPRYTSSIDLLPFGRLFYVTTSNQRSAIIVGLTHTRGIMIFAKFVLTAQLLAVATAQTTDTCFSGSVTVASVLTACNYLSSAYQSCNTKTGSALDACVCRQDVFAAIYE